LTPEPDVFDKSVVWGAPVLAFIIGFLRSLRDDKQFIASCIEGGLLAMAAFGVQPIFNYLGMPTNLAWGAAVWLGYIGVDAISRTLKKRTKHGE
jgi:lambda family phage holin